MVIVLPRRNAGGLYNVIGNEYVHAYGHVALRACSYAIHGDQRAPWFANFGSPPDNCRADGVYVAIQVSVLELDLCIPRPTALRAQDARLENTV